jgi:hypothetical protein
MTTIVPQTSSHEQQAIQIELLVGAICDHDDADRYKRVEARPGAVRRTLYEPREHGAFQVSDFLGAGYPLHTEEMRIPDGALGEAVTAAFQRAPALLMQEMVRRVSYLSTAFAELRAECDLWRDRAMLLSAPIVEREIARAAASPAVMQTARELMNAESAKAGLAVRWEIREENLHATIRESEAERFATAMLDFRAHLARALGAEVLFGLSFTYEYVDG